MQAVRILKRFVKSFLAVLICSVVIFISAYREPVHVKAAATAATVAGVVLVAAAASALGIGVSAAMNNESYTQACANVWNRMSSSVQQAAQPIKLVGNYLQCQFSKAFLQSTLDGLRTQYPDKTLADYGFDFAKYLNWDMSKITVPTGYGWYHYLRSYNMTNAYILSTGTIGSNMSIDLGVASVYLSGEGTIVYKKVTTSAGYDYSFFQGISSSHIGAPYAVISFTTNNSLWRYALITYENYSSGVFVEPQATVSNPPTVSLPDVYIPALESLFAQGYSVMNHSLQDVIDRIGALQGEVDGIRVALPDAVGTLTSINDLIKSLTQQDVTQTDATDTAEKEANKTANQNRDTTVPKNPTTPDLTIPEQLIRKFPFCLPFDFVNSIKILSAPAKPPKFTLPLFVVPAFGWNTSLTLAWEEFDKKGILGGICRWGFSVLWVIGLIFITKKLIWK